MCKHVFRAHGRGERLPPEAVMVLTAPGMDSPLHVALAPHPERGARRNVTVWEWSGDACDEGDDAAAWFSAYLGAPMRLVRFSAEARRRTGAAATAAGGVTCDVLNSSHARRTDPVYADATTLFSDGFPFLLISEGSLEGTSLARLHCCALCECIDDADPPRVLPAV